MTNLSATNIIRQTPTVNYQATKQAIALASQTKAPKGYECTHIHLYTDDAGNFVYAKPRYKNHTTGDKWLRSYSLDSAYQWQMKNPDFTDLYPKGQGKKPLYRLHELVASHDVVYIFEGEQKADLAKEQLFLTATTAGGSTAVDSHDWQPLKGRQCVLWRDKDEAGQAWLCRVLEALQPLDCRVLVIDVDKLDLPPKSDIVDYVEAMHAAGKDDADILQAIKNLPTLESEQVLELLTKQASDSVPDDSEGSNGKAASYLSWHGDNALLDTPVKYEGGRFEVYQDGLYFVNYEHEAQTNRYHKQGYPLRISDPLYIKALIRGRDSNAWGILLEWLDKDRKRHEWAMPAALLQGDSKEFRQILADMGLGISPNPKARYYLTAYLQTYDTPKRALSVNKTGWHDDSYVLPHTVIGQSQDEPIYLQTSAPLEHGYGVKGTLEDWQQNLAIPVANQSRIAFAVSCGFSGQLLELLSEKNGGGFHFIGTSSVGKSLALEVAASIWGGDMVRSWNSTNNALEGIAALHNDAFLCLDEINEADNKTIGKAVYMLANGKPKGRMTKNITMRESVKFRIMFLSSGEQTLESYLQAIGEPIKAGQVVRLCNIEADTGRNIGIFDSLTLADTAAKQVEILRHNTGLYYGAAGIEWLEYLTSNKDNAANQAYEYIAQFMAMYSQANEQANRVAKRFAIVAAAGELATLAGVTGWQAGQAMTAAKICLDSWLTHEGTTGNREEHQIITQVQAFIQAHGSSRFSDWDSESYERVPNCVGFYRKNDDCYYIHAALFDREVCSPFSRKQVCVVLDNAGMLSKSNGYQKLVKSNDRDKKGYFYCIKSDILNLSP